MTVPVSAGPHWAGPETDNVWDCSGKRSTKTGKKAAGQSLRCTTFGSAMWQIYGCWGGNKEETHVQLQTGPQSSFTLCLLLASSEKYRCAFLISGHFPHPRLERSSQSTILYLLLLCLGAFLAFLLSVIYTHSCQDSCGG